MNFRSSGVSSTLAGFEHVLVRVGRRAVDRRDELDGQRAVVADLLERVDDPLPVERAHAAGHAVVVGHVEVVRGVPWRCGSPATCRVSSMFMWKASRQMPQSGPTALRQQQRLVVAVQEIGLEAVERLDRQPHAFFEAVLVALLQALRPPTATPPRATLPATSLPTVPGTIVISSPPSSLTIVMHVLHVLHRHRPVLAAGRQQVAIAEHQRHRAPARQPVVLQQLADVLGVVSLGLAADLDRVVAAFRQPRDRRLDRLRPHPVVHRHSHTERSSGEFGPLDPHPRVVPALPA